MDDLDMSLDDLAQKNKPQQQQRPQRPAGGSGGGRGGRPGGVARTASGTGPGDRSGTRSPYSRPPPASADAPWKHDMFGGARSNPGSGTHTPRSGGRYEADRPTDRPTARLRIENVHYEIQPFQLEKIFAQAGELVDKPNIIYDRAGRSTGLAFVTYSSVADATLAKDKLDGQRANGEPIRIHYVPVALPVKTEGRVDKLGRAVGPAVDNSGKPLLGRLGGILGSGGEEPKREYQRADRGGEREREPRGVGAHRGGAAPARGAGGAGGRGGGRGGTAAGGGRGGKREAREPRKAKTGDALDEELEAFMRAPPAEASAAKPSDAMEE